MRSQSYPEELSIDRHKELGGGPSLLVTKDFTGDGGEKISGVKNFIVYKNYVRGS